MKQQELIPHLFRTEFSKITAVLGKLFGFEYIEIAEDIASDTFLLASETWSLKGLPENPVAWLYTVAKNKARDYLRRNKLFNEKITAEIQYASTELHEIEIDLSDNNIIDSQLQMMFAICQPSIPAEAQIGLSLRILCGFGIEEIANAFLSNKETINKRLTRAREKLREENVKIAFPAAQEIDKRLENVLTTLYLLFNEGYYSLSQNTTLRKELCFEATRLSYLLTINEATNKPVVNALLALMCFQASRLEARTNENGEQVLYEDQDTNLWDQELINRGKIFLNKAAEGNDLSKYHIEAGIAWWHTDKQDTAEKWDGILQLYNRLLIIEYSPMAALNRTYALSKANGKPAAIIEAEKLNLNNNHLYYTLLGYLYTDVDNEKAIEHLKSALKLAKSETAKITIEKSISKVTVKA
ncbi:sigma-70 family RNA polymerase sigma factor [Mucilaginibacter sp. BJC16-A38]|uniref:RNA polymerase sigma factor n=1 Tax=Mucilaginibacter phenanthrenivorans TaxID=1234842 RepID=UPI0021585EE9|nr:sigma-70 family RNA polymerase sigma factor [Mucilaginibacter phenanthrenivorans]MCR8561485.1 sigma-70 family RNA polymerase sigma factor [Mucilaginibacter phenanthrenivorans]